MNPSAQITSALCPTIPLLFTYHSWDHYTTNGVRAFASVFICSSPHLLHGSLTDLFQISAPMPPCFPAGRCREGKGGREDGDSGRRLRLCALAGEPGALPDLQNGSRVGGPIHCPSHPWVFQDEPPVLFSLRTEQAQSSQPTESHLYTTDLVPFCSPCPRPGDPGKTSRGKEPATRTGREESGGPLQPHLLHWKARHPLLKLPLHAAPHPLIHSKNIQ